MMLASRHIVKCSKLHWSEISRWQFTSQERKPEATSDKATYNSCHDIWTSITHRGQSLCHVTDLVMHQGASERMRTDAAARVRWQLEMCNSCMHTLFAVQVVVSCTWCVDWLLEMGFSNQQAQNAASQYDTVQQALDSLLVHCSL